MIGVGGGGGGVGDCLLAQYFSHGLVCRNYILTSFVFFWPLSCKESFSRLFALHSFVPTLPSYHCLF